MRKAGARASAKIDQLVQDLYENWPNFSAPTFITLSFFQNFKSTE
jgi:hypothetical protein